MRVLVTGGSGFLGKALCLQLQAMGHTVAYLSRTESKELKQKNIEWIAGDISHQEVIGKLKGFHSVFHAAAIAGYWGQYEDYYKINVEGTKNILKACDEHQIGYLVYTSSPSIVFDQEPIAYGDEDLRIPEKHLCFYSNTKAQAEKLVLQANTKGLKTVALRPHLIWGPGDSHLLPRVIRRAKDGKLKIVGDGQNKVDMIYIDNAVAGHLQAWAGLMEGKPCAGRAYFISDDKPVLLWGWLNQLLPQLGLPLVTRRISLKTAYRIGGVLEFFYKMCCLSKEPPMTRFLAYSLGTDHYFDISRAKSDFQYKIVVDPEDGLAQTLIYLKELL